MNHSYNTISKMGSSGAYREKGSKFLSFAYRVHSEDDIKTILEDLRKKYHDARHHCYAWILGEEATRFRANDDGEPSGTAGNPILQQIRSFELTNILIVVVRYFGGTLLGTSGLIRAYKNAARDALEQAEICLIYMTRPYSLHFPYALMNDVMKILKEFRIKPEFETYDTICELQADVPIHRIQSLHDRLEVLQSVQIKAL